MNHQGWVPLGLTIISMATVVVFTIVPLHVVWESWFFNTNWQTQDDLYQFFNIIAYAVGLLLLLLQLHRLIGEAWRSCSGDEASINTSNWRKRWLTPGIIKKEHNCSRAAIYKVQRMVGNALQLHGPQVLSLGQQERDAERPPLRSSIQQNHLALSNFMSTSGDTEPLCDGGYLWAWKGFLDGSLCYKEGIWFHTRLLAAAKAQPLAFLSHHRDRAAT